MPIEKFTITLNVAEMQTVVDALLNAPMAASRSVPVYNSILQQGQAQERAATRSGTGESGKPAADSSSKPRGRPRKTPQPAANGSAEHEQPTA